MTRLSRREVLPPLAGLVCGAAGNNAKCARQLWRTLPATPPLPSPDRTGFVQSNGAQLFVAEFGEGTPVILLHGGLANANYWGNQIPALARHMRVIAVDTRGHGRSTMSAQPLTYDLLAADVFTVMDNHKLDSAAIVGWSDGGIVGLKLASAQPDRVSVLFTFGANATRGGVRPGGGKSPVFRQFVGRCAREYRAISPTPNGFTNLQSALDRLWSSGPDIDRAQLAAIRARSCIADGEYDEIIERRETETIARAIPSAELLIAPCVSHFAMLQDPNGFTQSVLKALQSV
jgi:pimeloyl-ACP methyl ester carboxylesterase